MGVVGYPERLSDIPGESCLDMFQPSELSIRE